MRFLKLWIAIYYLVKGRQTAANYRNNLSIDNLTKTSAKSKAMVRSLNRIFKLIKSMRKILRVLPHLKCSVGHHIPQISISESEVTERKEQYLQSWENYHMKKQVQQDQAPPSWTKASSIKRHHIMSHKHVPTETEVAINSCCI